MADAATKVDDYKVQAARAAIDLVKPGMKLGLGTGSTAGPLPDAGGTLATAEKAAILEALAAVGGHRKKAAERLGIGERTLYDKLKVYGIK